MRFFLFFLGLTCHLVAQEAIFPEVRRNPDVPDLKKVMGYDFGKQISLYFEAVTYGQRLAAESPVVAAQYHGRTWEARRLMLLIVTSERNHARLEDLLQAYRALADPRLTSPKQAAELGKDLPALVWLSQSVHGDEPSGTDSGLFLAYHLASALDDPAARRILDNTVVVIELMQNPDGRDRFVNHYRQNATLDQPDPDPRAVEHAPDWTGGRYNHYLFDLNRDWFLVSQPETQARIRAMLAWRPQVVVDLHEMSGNRSFFAATPAPPFNPFLSADVFDGYQRLGRAIGKVFDQNGLDYFHSEIYDGLYPGYGESWPSLQGALGVLFEQAATDGLVRRLADGELLTHRQAVARQTLASLALLDHVAADPAGVIAAFYAFRRHPMEQIHRARHAFLLPGTDRARMMLLGGLLQVQGIDVEQLKERVGLAVSARAGGDTQKEQLPAGSLLVRLDQPAGNLARTLLVNQIQMDPAFLHQQDVRRANRREPRFYDITAWSLPRLYGVPVRFSGVSGFSGEGERMQSSSQFLHPEARLAFLIRNNIHTGTLLGDLSANHIRASFTKQTIQHKGIDFPPGSLIVRRRDQPDDLVDRLTSLAKTHGLTIAGVDSSWFEQGPSFGSSSIKPIPLIHAAMPWGEPTKPESAGWMRFTFDRLLKQPITAVKPRLFAKGEFSDFNVIALPDGEPEAWRKVFTAKGVDEMKRWLQAGGVLIAVGRTLDFLSHEEVGLLFTARERGDGTLVDDAPPAHSAQPITDPDAMIQPRVAWPDKAHGALVDVHFDTNHWLCYGMNARQTVLFNSNRIYRPLPLDQGQNPGRYPAAAQLDPAGYIPAETLAQLPGKAFVMVQKHGQGLVIAFTEDPNFRTMQKGLLPLMTNAVFFGPAHIGSKR